MKVEIEMFKDGFRLKWNGGDGGDVNFFGKTEHTVEQVANKVNALLLDACEKAKKELLKENGF